MRWLRLLKTNILHENTTWKKALAVVVYFLLFTFFLSSGLFVSKLRLELGDPSPQLITAPWEKNIEDLEKYHEDQELAAKSVKAVYKADEDYLTGINRDLGNSFAALREAMVSRENETNRINKLRQVSPYATLPDGLLMGLLKASVENLEETEQLAREIILGNARSTDTGAMTQADVAALRDLMKQEVDKNTFPDNLKMLIKTFIDTKITRPTLIIDENATEKAKQLAKASVRLEVHQYKANQKIIGPGEIVSPKVLAVLAAYGLIENTSPWGKVGGIALIVLACMGMMLLFIQRYRQKTPQMLSKAILMGMVIGLVLLIARGMVSLNLGGQEFNAFTGLLIPVAWATMTVAILVDAEIAFLISVFLSVFIMILVDPNFSSSQGMQIGIYSLFSGLVGVHSVTHLSQRSDLARAGLYVAGANVVLTSALALITGMGFTTWVVACLLGIVGGIGSSIFTVGTLHWFETLFHITSAVRLLELSNPNRPLLKKLMMEAPGTYNHSILVGNLAERAAEAVQADAILVRVGAMYHDIGKLKRPYFFIENQFALDNPHDKIAPTLSTLIITSHVKDGLEMAREHKLPQGIQDIISQHHGDSSVSYFYHKAKAENPDIPIDSFQYEGPKPQTKEAALVSLADSVEAAVRSMKNPSPGRIEGLVRKIIKDKLNDDQLSQCDLTFQDLDKIAKAFVQLLSGIFHSRIEYPELVGREEKGKGPQEKGDDEVGEQSAVERADRNEGGTDENRDGKKAGTANKAKTEEA